MASHSGDLEIRWLLHSPAGPVVVRVQTRDRKYVATLDAAPPELASTGHMIADTASEALQLMVDAVGGGAVIPLPPRERRT